MYRTLTFLTFGCWALMLAGVLAQQPASPTATSPALDYDFFKTRVQPIFVNKRPGHARCIACHGQGTPDARDFDLSELNIPAKNRFNAGVNVSQGRFLGDLSVNYSGSAFWQDVLDDPYHGTTEAYTLVNGGFGVRRPSRRRPSKRAAKLGSAPSSRTSSDSRWECSLRASMPIR